MAQGVGARYQGGHYQHRLFWLAACRLFYPSSNVAKVGLEVGEPHGFDDLAEVYQTPAVGPRGEQVVGTFWQAKFHRGSEGAFTAESLTDPGYIGSKTRTLLRNLRDAVESYPDACFRFATVDGVAPGDPIGRILSNHDAELLLDRLYDDTGRRGTMGALRRAWSKHLSLTEEDLRPVLKALRLETGGQSLKALNQKLDLSLRLAGLAPLYGGASHSPYDDLAEKFVVEQLSWFDRESLDKRLVQEGLRHASPVNDPLKIVAGIRSFLRGTDEMPERLTPFLDLLPFFDERAVADGTDWETVAAEVRGFMRRAASRSRQFTLCLATHNTLAFVAGREVDAKSGVVVYPMQRTWGEEEAKWTPNEGALGPPIAAEVTQLREAPEIAVALSLTHHIEEDVKRYIRTRLPSVGQLVHLVVEGGPSGRAVRGGAHGFRLAAQVIAEIRKARRRGTPASISPIHLFWAAPVALVFLLGQQSRVLGDCQLYEHEFGAASAEVYSPSIRL